MIKFKTPQDREIFLQELYQDDYSGYVQARLLNEDSENTLDSQKYITGKRKDFAVGLKDFRKSQAQKANWRANKYKYLKGIREFSRSVEGKQFHRRLSRYLVSRGVLRKPNNQVDKLDGLSKARPEEFNSTLGRYDAPDFLVALSSCKTHLLIETRYYQTVSDEVDYFLMLEAVVKKLNNLETRILESMTNYEEFELTEEDIEFLEAIVGDFEYENGENDER